MTKGRKPKPTHLRIVEGDKSNRGFKKARNEPVPPGILSADTPPPKHFNEDQAEAWRTGLESAPFGLLRRLDGGVYAAWCVAFCIHAYATEKLNSGSYLIKTAGGPQQSPWISMINKQAVIMRGLASELGFSPAARTRVSVEEGLGVEDPTDRFFGS